MRTLLPTFVVVGVFWTAAANANLIKNGGFETGDFSKWAITLLLDTPSSDVSIYTGSPSFPAIDGSYSAQLGAESFSEDLGGPSLSWVDLAQNVHTGKGVPYLISFDISPPLIPGGGLGNGTHVTVPGLPCDVVADPTCSVLTVDFGGSQVFQLSDSAGPETINILAFGSAGNSLLNFDFFNTVYWIDDISVTRCNKTCQSGITNLAVVSDALILPNSPIASVPEPPSWAILMAGMLALFVVL